jgi:hypothetical protein
MLQFATGRPRVSTTVMMATVGPDFLQEKNVSNAKDAMTINAIQCPFDFLEFILKTGY